MSRRSSLGVFCIEDRVQCKERQSIGPALNLLQNCSGVALKLREARSTIQALKLIDSWLESGADKFPILFICAHGSPGVIYFGEDALTLVDLGRYIADRASGRMIHLSSCSTLEVTDQKILHFLDASGAKAISGFAEDVDVTTVLLFEMLMLKMVANYGFSRNGLAKSGISLKEQADGLASSLGFIFIVK